MDKVQNPVILSIISYRQNPFRIYGYSNLSFSVSSSVSPVEFWGNPSRGHDRLPRQIFQDIILKGPPTRRYTRMLTKLKNAHSANHEKSEQQINKHDFEASASDMHIYPSLV
jgi:hypothetical protein